MGRRQKRNSQESAPMNRQQRAQLDECVDVLLQATLRNDKGWDNYTEIYGLVKRICELERGISFPKEAREHSFPRFNEWLQEHKIDMSSVEIVHFPGHGYGLRARKGLKKGELILSIPQHAVLSSAYAKTTCLADVCSTDPILREMPNVLLSLVVLHELVEPSSKWRPYLQVFPDSFTTPSYFSMEEMALLKGSTAFDDAINMCRNIARQYAYFYRLLQKAVSGSALQRDFTYQAYRWATSAVMTRQNALSSNAGSMLALLPVLDFCNHKAGLPCTDLNASHCAELFAMEDVPAGTQVYNFYGQRTNSQYLVHNGFVVLNNESDVFPLRLGLSKGDPLSARKGELLSRFGLCESSNYPVSFSAPHFTSELLTFVKVFISDETGLLELKEQMDSAKETDTTDNLRPLLSREHETKVWAFLETRLRLVARTIQGSTQLEDLSPCARQAMLLRAEEHELLSRVADYAHSRLQATDTQGEHNSDSTTM